MKFKNTSKLSRVVAIQKLLANPFVVIFSNWVFQGMRYMEKGERYFKIFCTLIPSFIFMYIIWRTVGQINFGIISFCFAAGHTINWIFNGQLFVLMRYVPTRKNMTIKKMKLFVEDIYKRTGRANYLQAVLIFGSFSRGEIGSTSDLDVRIMRKEGLQQALRAYILAMKLRFLAFVKGFPLDVYTFGDISYLERLRKDEPPIIVLDNAFVEKYYKNFSFYQEALNRLKFRNE